MQPGGLWELVWVGSELQMACQGVKRHTLEGGDGLQAGKDGTRKGFCPGETRKGALRWPGRGPGENVYLKLLTVPVCASDFSFQRKRLGESFEGLPWPTVLMPSDGRGKKPNVSQNQGGAFKC